MQQFSVMTAMRLGILRDAMDVVKRHRFGDVLHDVENVIHAIDQLMDFIAIERGDEGGVQLGKGIVGNCIGLAFEGIDFLGIALGLFGCIDQRSDQIGQRPCRLGQSTPHGR
jgi:hypothetical protein